MRRIEILKMCQGNKKRAYLQSGWITEALMPLMTSSRLIVKLVQLVSESISFASKLNPRRFPLERGSCTLYSSSLEDDDVDPSPPSSLSLFRYLDIFLAFIIFANSHFNFYQSSQLQITKIPQSLYLIFRLIIPSLSLFFAFWKCLIDCNKEKHRKNKRLIIATFCILFILSLYTFRVARWWLVCREYVNKERSIDG